MCRFTGFWHIKTFINSSQQIVALRIVGVDRMPKGKRKPEDDFYDDEEDWEDEEEWDELDDEDNETEDE